MGWFLCNFLCDSTVCIVLVRAALRVIVILAVFGIHLLTNLLKDHVAFSCDIESVLYISG